MSEPTLILKSSMKMILSEVLFLLSAIAYAGGDLPSWIHDPPSSSGDVYVVGIGDAHNANDAQNEARQRGWTELVEQVLGVDGSSRFQSDANISNSSYSQRTEISTSVVGFNTLITVNKHIETLPSGDSRCYLLLKIPQSEVLRLRKLVKGSRASGLLSRLLIETSPSGAQLSMDGEVVGITPIRVLLPPKSYTLQFKKEGYRSLEKIVVADVGKDLSLNIPLEEATGTLSISIAPSEAEIYLDGRYLGQGNLAGTPVPAGSHAIEFRANGFKTQEKTIQVRRDKAYELQISLDEKPKKAPRRSPPRSQASEEPNWDKKAQRLVKRSAWPELASLGREWVSYQASNPNSQFYAGYGMLKLHRIEPAIEYLEKSVSLFKDRNSLQALCEAYNLAGNFRTAKKHCEESLEIDLKNAGAYAEIARSFLGLREFKRAYDNMMVAVSLNRVYNSELRQLCTSSGLHLHEKCARFNYPTYYK